MGRRRRVGSAAFLWLALADAVRQEQELPISHLALLLASPQGIDFPRHRLRLQPLNVATTSDFSSAITKWSKRRGTSAKWPRIDGSRRHTKWDFPKGHIALLEGTKAITKYAAEELNGESIPMLEGSRRIKEYDHFAAVDSVAGVGEPVGEPGVAHTEFAGDVGDYEEEWEALVAESSLERAFLDGNDDVSDEGWEDLLSPLANPEQKLRRLGLKNCDLDDDSAKAIGESFAKLSPYLKTFDLSMNQNMKADTWTALLYPFTLDCRLEEVCFSWCNLQDVNAQSLGMQLMEMPPHVKKLNYGGNPRLGATAWSCLLSPLTLAGTNFQDVSFEDCNLDDADATVIRDQMMNMFQSIEVLNFAGNPELTSAGWKTLLRSLSASGEGFGANDNVGVNFGWCDFSDGHAAVIAEALGKTSSGIKRLNFEGNWQMPPDAWSAFLKPLQNTDLKLEEINFGNCNLDAERSKVIAGHLSTLARSIRRLDFGGNARLSSEGWNALLKPLATKSCRLKVVNFAECNLDDMKAKAIGEQMARLPSKVKTLDFRGDDGLSPEGWTELLQSGATSSAPGEDGSISSKDVGVIDADWEKV